MKVKAKSWIVWASMLTSIAIVSAIVLGTIRADNPVTNEQFELGDGIEPAVPGVADVMGSVQEGPDWDDLFTVDRSPRDEFDEFGNPGSNGVPDFLDTWGNFRARRDAVFVHDGVSAGSTSDPSVPTGPALIGSGTVEPVHDIGNAYAYTTLSPDLAGNLDLILYAGVERLSNVGSSEIVLEFNQEAVIVNADGTIDQHRTGGDLRVRTVFESYLLSVVEVQLWALDPTDGVAKYLTRETLGQTGEPAEQCNASASVCALSNAIEITGGSWPSYGESGDPVESLSSDTFFELGVNIGQLVGSDMSETRYATMQLTTPQDFALGDFERADTLQNNIRVADGSLGGDSAINGCMQDVAGFNLNCTANDIRVAETFVTIIDECEFPGDTATVLLDVNVELTAQARHDIGVYMALDGGNALHGSCMISTLPYGPAPDFTDLDGTNDDPNGLIQDTCGDIDNDPNPIFHGIGEITVTCIDDDGDGLLDLPTCTSWRQPGANEMCLSPLDAFPGAPSKCRCESVTLDVPVPKVIEVRKVLDPVDDLGVFDLQIDGVTEVGDVTDGGTTGKIDVEVGPHSVGEVAGTGTDLAFYDASIECRADGGTGSVVASCNDCTTVSVDVPEAQTDIVCTITNVRAIVPPVLSVVKSNDADQDGVFSDTETTPETLPVTVAYEVSITNDAESDAVITAIGDDTHDIAGSSCAALLDSTIGANSTVTCTFDVDFADDNQSVTNVFEVTAGNAAGSDTASDDSTVITPDLAPSISVDKTANPTSVDEPGGTVTFSIVVTNTSYDSDPVTIDSMLDDVHGDLTVAANTSCTLPQTLQPGENYSCAFEGLVSGNAGYVEVDTVTASGQDDDGTPVSGFDDATVTLDDVPSAIEIVKTATPDHVDEPGGDVTFAFVVNNLSAVDDVTIDSLIDTIYGDLNGQGDCAVPQTLAAGGSYSCSFTSFVAGNAGDVHTNVATASGQDDDGNPLSDDDDATVTLDDVPSAIEIVKTATPDHVDEPGGDVTFAFVVNNLSAVDDVTIDSLIDTIYGDLNGQGDCSVPQTLAAGGSYSCSFTTFVAGNAGDVHTNVATASGQDDDGNPLTDDDDATVTLDDVPSAIEIVKTATPDHVDEPGGDVTFAFVVNNLSAVDDVTIDSLIDTIYGDLNGQGDCAVPQTLAAGGSYSCSFTTFVAGNAGDVHTNVATASGQDDDGNPLSDDDDATVTLDDVPSAIEIVKTATPDHVDEPGGDVTFAFVVNNLSAVDDVTIDSLIDTIYGDLNGQGDCAVPQTLAAGGSYSCSFTTFVAGNAGDVHTNVATASGTDDDGNPLTDDDDATVTLDDVPSAIEIVKTATPDHVDEPGGDVTFAFVVNNLSAVDDVTIDSLIDTIYGDLNGQGDCGVPQTLAAGGSYSCSFTTFVAGNAGDVHTNVATASGTDDDGNPLTDDDDATVTLDDVPSAIEIVKTATPDHVDEPGGDVTFAFVVNNLSAVDDVTIDSLIDTIYGDLNGQGDCSVPQTLAAGGSYGCSFTTFVAGNAGDVHTNVATASGTDDDGNPLTDDDDATVTLDDVPSAIEIVKTATPDHVDEPGGDVTFAFVVNNLSAVDDVTIDSLIDTIYGDLNGQGDCAVPQTLAAGGSYSCSFTTLVAGNAGDVHTNVATASGTDDDGNPLTDDDDATVTLDDVPSAIEIVKTATPDHVDEPGGDVTFAFVVNNLSAVDDVTIDSLIDTIYGDLNGQGDCSVPQTLAAGGSYSCSFTTFVAGNAGDVHTNVATASGQDDDGNPLSDDDDATVTLDDVPSAIEVIKVAAPGSMDEPGDDITFTFTIKNISAVDEVTITSFVDNVLGDLNGQGDCSVPQRIAAGGSYTCSLTEYMLGEAGETHVNVATATGTDDDGNPVSDDDDEVVRVLDVASSIELTKTATPDSVDEPGANVVFDLLIANTSAVDSVTIDSLVDDVFGDLAGRGTCSVPQTLQVGGSYGCAFTAFVGGDGGDVHVNVATASGQDDDGNPVSDDDDATVTIIDLPSSIDVTKTANKETVAATGGYVEFTVAVTNTSPADAVTINEVSDDVFGIIATDNPSVTPAIAASATTCDELIGTVLPPGSTTACAFSAWVVPDSSGVHHDTVTVRGTDDDGIPVEDSDDAYVGVGGNPGTGTPGYWANHPDVWPLVNGGILIGDWNGNGTCNEWEAERHDGCIYYSQAYAIELLLKPVKGDKTIILSRALIAAWLNTVYGNDFTCIEGTLDEAISWQNAYPAGSGVGGGSDSPWHSAQGPAETLDDYNNGRLCAVSRDSELTMGKTRLLWTTPPGAVKYDLVFGRLSLLRASGGEYSSAFTRCLESDTTQTSTAFAPKPPLGDATWFVLRYETETGEDTYDSNSISQVGSRDQGIEVSPYGCP